MHPGHDRPMDGVDFPAMSFAGDRGPAPADVVRGGAVVLLLVLVVGLAGFAASRGVFDHQGHMGPQRATRLAQIPPPLRAEVKRPRSRWKCGWQLAARADRAKLAGVAAVAMPRGCADATLEAPYITVENGPDIGGLGVWRGAVYLAQLKGTGAPAPAPQSPPAAPAIPPVTRKVTITRDYWRKDPARGNAVVHVTEVEEEGR